MILALAAASASTTLAVALSHQKCPYATLVERSTTAGSFTGDQANTESERSGEWFPIFPASSPRESATWLEQSIIRQGSGSSFGSATRFVPNTQPRGFSLG